MFPVWQELVHIDHRRLGELLQKWNQTADKGAAVRHALQVPQLRGTALRLLLLEGDELSQAVFEDLIDVASVGHADVQLCRKVIKAMPRGWVLERLSASIWRSLARHPDDAETIRRFAELSWELDSRVLAQIVLRASQSSDPDVREVASDFADER